jgi:bifunctional DNA-binding transcriptional regulator/antitoxin component of YhaV-PrlF toxin-antitoxin module
MFPKIYGTMTLNEKSQAVIPADARVAMNLTRGSKLLVMGSPDGKALILVSTEHAEQMLKNIADMSTAIRDTKKEEANE